MADHTLTTPAGDMLFRQVDQGLLRRLAALWPMGVSAVPDQRCYAIFFQVGDREMQGIKLQPPDVESEHSSEILSISRVFIAMTAATYLRRGHEGIMLPCVYCRDKGGGQSEAGIALFMGPDPAGSEVRARDPMNLNDELGVGAGAMAAGFIEDLGNTITNLRLPTMQLIGIDVRPRLALGSIQLDLMFMGDQVLSLRKRPHAEDPIWSALLTSGISKIWHLPGVPAARPASTSC